MNTHFPTVPLETAIQTARVETEPPPPLVLVVDDEVLIVETLSAILNSHGLATMPALDGSAALELAQLAPPDVLIADAAMLGMDGFELALGVSRIAPNCDVILMSGEPSTCDLAAEYRARGCDFVLLIKPVHPQDLLACVFELLSLRGWLVPAEIGSRKNNPSDMVSLDPVPLRNRKENGHRQNRTASQAVVRPQSHRRDFHG